MARRLPTITLLLAAVFVSLTSCGKDPAHGGGEGDAPGRPQILYFMAFDCGGCRRVLPLVNQLHAEAGGAYDVLGLVYGTPVERIPQRKRQEGIRFPLEAGTREVAGRYGIESTPTFILLVHGQAKERFRGTKGARHLGQFMRTGAYGRQTGILELTGTPQHFAGRSLEISGLLRGTGGAGPAESGLVLSNGVEEVPVVSRPAPESAPQSPMLQGLVGDIVRLRGKIEFQNGRALLIVESGKRVE